MELAENADERSWIAVLELQEQRRSAGGQILPDLLHEADIDAGCRGTPDQSACDGSADDRSDRDAVEQKTAQHGTDRGALLGPARHLVVEVTVPNGVLENDG